MWPLHDASITYLRFGSPFGRVQYRFPSKPHTQSVYEPLVVIQSSFDEQVWLAQFTRAFYAISSSAHVSFISPGREFLSYMYVKSDYFLHFKLHSVRPSANDSSYFCFKSVKKQFKSDGHSLIRSMPLEYRAQSLPWIQSQLTTGQISGGKAKLTINSKNYNILKYMSNAGVNAKVCKSSVIWHSGINKWRVWWRKKRLSGQPRIYKYARILYLRTRQTKSLPRKIRL